MDPVSASLASTALSSATNLAGQVFGGYQGRKSSKRAAKYQRWNASWAANKLPSIQVQGLRRAGLNPILAVGGMKPQNLAPTSAPQIAANHKADNLAASIESISSARLKKKNEDLVSAQTDLTKTQEIEASNRALKEAGLAASAVAQSVIDRSTAAVYETKFGKKVLPIMRAATAAGLRPDITISGFSNSARSLAEFLFSKKRRPIGF